MKINEEVVQLYHMVLIVDTLDFTEPCGSQYALNYAKERNLDLVLMNGDLDMPICKIYDIKKKKFEAKKRQKDNKPKSKTKLKTIQLGLDISDNDISYRVKNATKFIDKKNQVKISLLIKGGRNMARGKETGAGIIKSFVNSINEQDLTWQAEFTSFPKLGGNTWTAIIIGKKKKKK